MYGSELSGVNADKGDLIRHALKLEGFEAAEPWMVGDRVHDVEAARKNGLATIGVLWGYGTEQELRNARPVGLVASMAELCDFVAAQQQAARTDAAPLRSKRVDRSDGDVAESLRSPLTHIQSASLSADRRGERT